MIGPSLNMNCRAVLEADKFVLVLRTASALRCVVMLTIIAGSLSTTGCNYLPWPETFGAVTPPNSTRSLNGLGVHKRLWETAGARVLTPQKLSPRLHDMDVLVLVGSTYEPPGRLARDWLENWLGEDTGRTVIYFGRDFDADLLYREQTLEDMASSDRDRAADIIGVRKAKQFVERLEQNPEDVFCRWFFLRTSARPTTHNQFTGPLAKELNGTTGGWQVRTRLEPPARRLRSKKPSWLAGKKPKLAPVNKFTTGDDSTQQLGDKEVQRSVWLPQEISTDEAWQAEWSAIGDVEILLAGADGEPLIHRITSADFEDSQILIVANGAPFLNGAMVQPLHRRVGELIIEECLPAKRVGLISYNESGLLISKIDSGGHSNVGLELLTVWPLSAITMHAAFLGIVVCIVLLPILGRPQGLPRRSVTDFGLHVEAMGQMLFQSRDINYAVTMIRDYFTKVRNEKPPEWLTQYETPGPNLANQKSAQVAATQPPVSGDKLDASGPPLPPDSGSVKHSEYDQSSPTDKPPINPLS